MLGKTNPRNHIGHITLSLFCSALLGELSNASEDINYDLSKKEMINLAIKSYTEIIAPDSIKQLKLSDLIFQDYQEIETLRQTLGTKNNDNDYIPKISNLRACLSNIIDQNTDKNIKRKNIEEAINFYYKLSQQSLINAETPVYI